MNAVPGIAPRFQNAEIWWINPWKLGFFFLIPFYILVFAAPHVFGPEIVTVRFRVYFDARLFALGLAFLLILFAWAALAIQLDIGRGGIASGRTVRINRLYLDALALAAIAAYGIWFHKLILNPSALIGAFFPGTSAIVERRLENQTIPGVTTASQFAVAYVIFFLHEKFVDGCRFTSPRYAVYFWVLIGLAVFRVYSWGERLALIEIVMPVLILVTVHRIKWERRPLRFALSLAPFIGIGLLVLYFAATEFLRSWVDYYQYHRTPFWEFVLTRILTYYYTALNNAAGMLVILDWPNWQFEHVLRWLHKFPFFVGENFRFLVGAESQRLLLDYPKEFLESFADPEFNNTSGIFAIFIDLGVPLGMLYAAIWGGTLGFWYGQMMRGEGLGSLMYPACYLSLLEILRVLYIADERAFPIFSAILLGYFFFGSRNERTATCASWTQS